YSENIHFWYVLALSNPRLPVYPLHFNPPTIRYPPQPSVLLHHLLLPSPTLGAFPASVSSRCFLAEEKPKQNSTRLITNYFPFFPCSKLQVYLQLRYHGSRDKVSQG